MRPTMSETARLKAIEAGHCEVGSRFDDGLAGASGTVPLDAIVFTGVSILVRD